MRGPARLLIALVMISQLASCATRSKPPGTALACLGTTSAPASLAFSGAPIAERDDSVAAGFSDENGRYGYLMVRSSIENARAVLLTAGEAGPPRAGYGVASRGDLQPFVDSLPVEDPGGAYQAMTGVLDAARLDGMPDEAEEAAAVEMAVLRAYGKEPPLNLRPAVNERAGKLLDVARASASSQPRDIVLKVTTAAGPRDIRLWVEPLERFLQGTEDYTTSVTVEYAGNSFDFTVVGNTCVVLPRLTQDQPVSVILVHHDRVPAGTILTVNDEKGGLAGALMLVDPLRTNEEFVITAGAADT